MIFSSLVRKEICWYRWKANYKHLPLQEQPASLHEHSYNARCDAHKNNNVSCLYYRRWLLSMQVECSRVIWLTCCLSSSSNLWSCLYSHYNIPIKCNCVHSWNAHFHRGINPLSDGDIRRTDAELWNCGYQWYVHIIIITMEHLLH